MNPTELFRPEPDPSSVADDTPAPPDDPRLLEALREYQSALDAGRTVDRDALLARYADVADALADCLDGLDFVVNAAAAPPPPPDAIAGGLPLGDYQIVREVGRGGMGVVYEAEQLSLRRRVALKVLPFAAALDPRQLQRFRAEAQAAACLHHTHIVPVYAVGSERGVHYYAMQFVDGHSLADLIRQLRRERSDAAQRSVSDPTPPSPALAGSTLPQAKHSSTRPGQDRDRFRTVATWGTQAAEALEYAHSVGIVHRDVKPANLLLDSRGTLYVADFGLAYFMNDGGLTLTGAVLGTLRYMSPEQARGERTVDPRTDVYSLGVTLYELLTLRDAFTGADRQELLRKVTEEEPTPPRRVNPAVPAELDLIVLKAMAKVPAERYATAKELADDLRDWLAYRPIKARRPTLRQRADKFVRRHAAVVATAAVALALLVATLTVGGVFLWRANQELVAKKNRLELKNRQTRGLLDKITGKAIDDLLSRQMKVNDEQRELLSDVLQDYEQFAAKSEDDPEALMTAVQAHLRVGQLRAKLGQAGAEESLRRALDLSQSLLKQDAESPEYRLLMARCRQEVGSYIYLARPEEAWSSYYSAVMMLNKLNEEYPKTPAYQRELAKAQSFLGVLYQNAEQWGQAEAALTKACRLHEELARADPGDENLRITWANGLVNLHNLLYREGRLKEAQAPIRDALSLLKPLTESDNADPRAVAYHSRALAGRAWLLWSSNQLSDAAEALQESQALADRLVESYPAVPEYRRLMAQTAGELGSLMSRMGRRPEAHKMLQKAAKLYAQLVADCPGEAPFQVIVAEAQRELCEQFFALGYRDDAEKSGRAAIKICERMNVVWPDRPQLLNQLAWLLATSPIESLRDPPRAESLARKVTEKERNIPAYWDTLGAALYRTGKWREAKTALSRALEMSHDQIPQSMLFLSMTACRLGDRRVAWDRHNQVASWLALCQRENCEVQRIAVEERNVLVASEVQHLVTPITRRVARAADDVRQWAARTLRPAAPP